MKKTRLLPVFGALASTAAIVTPLATSCSSWTRYTDMLSEYKPGVKSYKETLFVEADQATARHDIDELYWARFEKNNDILRDDMLWSLSKVICYDSSEEGGVLKEMFKNIDTYDFDIHVDEVIQDSDDEDEIALYDYELNADDEHDQLEDTSSIQFTIDWKFKAEFPELAKLPLDTDGDGQADRYMDVIDLDITFKTIDPWVVWFECNWTGETIGDDDIFDDEWIMSIWKPYVDIGLKDPTTKEVIPVPGMVCIEADVDYRYSTDSVKSGDKWESYNEHTDARYLEDLLLNLSSVIDAENTSVYAFFYLLLSSPLNYYTYGADGDGLPNYIPFCSHYLENVDAIWPEEP